MHLVISPPLTRIEMNSTFNDALKLKKKAIIKFKKVFWSAPLSSLFWDSFLVWLYAPLVCIWISPPDTSLRSCLSPGLLMGSWRYYFNPIERMILTPGYFVQKFRQFWTLARMWISDAAWRFEAGAVLILHSALCEPLLKFFKMHFAFFIGTSKPLCNLHSV